MKRSIWLWQLVGFSTSSLFGTVLHFLYEWLDGAAWVAPFSGVNESTWEHMKLLFWPMLFFAVAQSFFFRERVDFWCIKLKGTLLGLVLIPIIFYTYNGVIGKSPDWVNISIFFVAAAVAYIYEAVQFYKENTICTSPKSALAILLFVGMLFFIFSFNAPSLAIFDDPTSMQTSRY